MHAIETPVDMKVMHADNVESELPRIRNLEDYDFVFITNCYVPYEKQSFYSYADIKDISNYLSKYGFRLIEPSELEHEPAKSTLHVFKRVHNTYRQTKLFLFDNCYHQNPSNRSV